MWRQYKFGVVKVAQQETRTKQVTLSVASLFAPRFKLALSTTTLAVTDVIGEG